MTADQARELRQKIDVGLKVAVAKALEEHRRAGHSIVIWKGGKIVTVPPDEIVPRQVAK